MVTGASEEWEMSSLMQRQSVEGEPRVSIVIPVYNGERTIERCLESVMAQEAPFAFEVVVADSSEDRTPEIIAERFPGVRLIHLAERAYPGTARNVGIRETRAPLVALIDEPSPLGPERGM